MPSAADLVWQRDAACPDYPPEWWFPPRGGSSAQAKSICARCLVRPECLDYAQSVPEQHGVWGGLSERQRRALRALRRGRLPARPVKPARIYLPSAPLRACLQALVPEYGSVHSLAAVAAHRVPDLNSGSARGFISHDYRRVTHELADKLCRAFDLDPTVLWPEATEMVA